MYHVTIYPEYLGRYTSLLEAGLYELQYAKLAIIHYSGALAAFKTREWRSHPCVRMHVSNDRFSAMVTFDLSDGPEFHPEYLEQSSVYFKRGFVDACVAALPAAQKQKVLPMDFHYACQSEKESYRDVANKLFAQACNTREFSLKRLRAIARIAKGTWQHRNALKGTPLETQPILASSYESSPERLVENKVFFRTRVYQPEDAAGAASDGSLANVNNMRANTVRALREAFGERFVGGLRASDYAKQTYPDCLDNSQADYVGHIEATKSVLVNVTTSGLHGSTGWKLPEFIAASSCVVSETIHQRSANPLKKGENYLEFRSPEGCVKACQSLLNDLDLAQSMRIANRRYHQKYLRSDQFMLNRLQEIERHCSSDTRVTDRDASSRLQATG